MPVSLGYGDEDLWTSSPVRVTPPVLRVFRTSDSPGTGPYRLLRGSETGRTVSSVVCGTLGTMFGDPVGVSSVGSIDVLLSYFDVLVFVIRTPLRRWIPTSSSQGFTTQSTRTGPGPSLTRVSTRLAGVRPRSDPRVQSSPVLLSESWENQRWWGLVRVTHDPGSNSPGPVVDPRWVRPSTSVL